jgi:hypothetical protein
MVTSDEAVQTAWQVARDLNYETDVMAVARVVEGTEHIDVSLGRPTEDGNGWWRGAALRVVIDKETGDVVEAEPQR